MGFREDMSHDQGATPESINALPTYKFKSKRQHTRGEGGSNSDSQGDGGIFAPGTDKEITLSAEDAVGCICLVKYLNNGELRELPCSHLFHKGCVNKWLEINALCPLCKLEVGNAASSTISSGNTGGRQEVAFNHREKCSRYSRCSVKESMPYIKPPAYIQFLLWRIKFEH